MSRLDRVWSREGSGPQYVQSVLLASADRLRRWVDEGAAVFVCGRRLGMGEAVDRTLALVLGEQRLAALEAAGHYRRDLYD